MNAAANLERVPGSGPTWLAAQRAAVVERLAALPEGARGRALSMGLSPAEERAMASLLEHGHVDDRWMEALVDALVLDERVVAACQRAATDAEAVGGFPTWTELGAAAVDLEIELQRGEARASAAGWSGLAAQARVSQLRIHAVRERLRPFLPASALPAAAGTANPAAGRRSARSSNRILAIGLSLLVLVGSVAWGYREARNLEPDPREAIGAEEFADLLRFDRIVVEGGRLAAVIRGWELMPAGTRQTTVDQVCTRLRARGFESVWLYDQSAKVVVDCHRGEIS